ncbi:G2/mitotic-specific cyclin-1 [Thalictrum thalictroides]|uniref:G2/mitotic-specific cyclin-1 n=1 Tax=Thalictrum thalictroides TaxID=46969 RepID=A0A7J6VDT8_THATH|nr:G2/mitotic-specific cyclin-1 [Thalictrum thalictroides]
MASRPIVPTQNRGGDALNGKAKQKAGIIEGNNRRALIDVTNRGVVAKPQPINRPVTRSFCAQLLAKAQDTVNENNQKQIAVVVDGPIGGNEDRAVQKKVTVKPKPEVVIVISPEERKVTVKPKPEVVIEISPETKADKSDIRRQARESSSRKKNVHTTTYILTARSKLACGITNKPKDIVMDIDAADANNQLAAVEYVEDIYKYYKLTENSSRAHDYMATQHEINEKMRGILVDWLIEVHNKFELMPETLYLTIHIVDRYLAGRAVSKKILQLVGMSAMLIASKYEEIWAPEVNDFVTIADNAYSREQVLAMEKLILGKLEWSLTVPTSYVFLGRYIKAAVSDQKMENMVFFLAELGLMHYELITYSPSMIAASAVYAARCTLNRNPLWDETLKCHTGFSESQLQDCAKLLVKFHSMVTESNLQTVYRKYSNVVRGAVSLITPAKILLA